MLAGGEQLVGLGVVERDRGRGRCDCPSAARDHLHAVVDQRQRAQAQEVHLEQADALDALHVELRRDVAGVALVERHELRQRPRRDHDARRVDRGVARRALEPPRDVDQLLDLRVLLVGVLERRRLVERLVQRHLEVGRDHLGDLVDLGVAHVEHAPDVAHDRLRLHRAEGDDLRHVLAPYFLRDVLDDLAAPVLAEVDVDVGRADALRVQEALEDQVVLDRVDVRDAQAVGDQAAGGRAATRADRDAAARWRSG